MENPNMAALKEKAYANRSESQLWRNEIWNKLPKKFSTWGFAWSIISKMTNIAPQTKIAAALTNLTQKSAPCRFSTKPFSAGSIIFRSFRFVLANRPNSYLHNNGINMYGHHLIFKKSQQTLSIFDQLNQRKNKGILTNKRELLCYGRGKGAILLKKKMTFRLDVAVPQLLQQKQFYFSRGTNPGLAMLLVQESPYTLNCETDVCSLPAMLANS